MTTGEPQPMRTAPLATILAILAPAVAAAGEEALPKAPDFWKPADAAPRLQAQAAHPRPNVILLIGDGMGINQIAAARRVAAGVGGRLGLDLLPVAGLALTHAANAAVTDSAAAGTALSAGIKTRNGAVGVDPDGVDQLTILEGLRRAKGYRTGLVVTKNVTDATPAAFVAEVPSRKTEADIALQLVEERVDVVFGGGRALFAPKAADGAREDGKDLLAEQRAAGVQVVDDPAGLAALDRLPALGLFAAGVLDSNRSDQPTLEAMTLKALHLLAAGGQPFFLMVEGSQIDSGGHKNSIEYAVRETLHFDLAVRAACAFAAARDDTLVVITADHETGGLMLFEGGVHWASKGHSGSPVGVFAGGAGAAAFGGVMDNTEIPRRIAALTGLAPFPAADAGR